MPQPDLTRPSTLPPSVRLASNRFRELCAYSVRTRGIRRSRQVIRLRPGNPDTRRSVVFYGQRPRCHEPSHISSFVIWESSLFASNKQHQCARTFIIYGLGSHRIPPVEYPLLGIHCRRDPQASRQQLTPYPYDPPSDWRPS